MKHLSTAQLALTRGLRTRGRFRIASEEQRDRNYRDENGQYQLVDGLQPWHRRIVDFMVANPAAKIVDIADFFCVTPVWIGILIKTDAFREYYGSRMEEHQGQVGKEIISKLQGVATESLDQLYTKLKSPTVKFDQVEKVASMAVKALGHGQGPSLTIKSEGPVQVHVNSDLLDSAREKMRKHMKENTKTIEHSPAEYEHVTAALELDGKQVEDAILIEDAKEI